MRFCSMCPSNGSIDSHYHRKEEFAWLNRVLQCQGNIRRRFAWSSEMLFGKGAAGVGFEVGFKIHGFFLGAESNSAFDDPWTVFGGVGHLAGVVSLETFFQVFGKSGVMAGLVCFAG